MEKSLLVKMMVNDGVERLSFFAEKRNSNLEREYEKNKSGCLTSILFFRIIPIRLRNNKCYDEAMAIRFCSCKFFISRYTFVKIKFWYKTIALNWFLINSVHVKKHLVQVKNVFKLKRIIYWQLTFSGNCYGFG